MLRRVAGCQLLSGRSLQTSPLYLHLHNGYVLSPQFRLVVKTALKLLLVFVEYSESNAPLLIQAISAVDTKRGE